MWCEFVRKKFSHRRNICIYTGSWFELYENGLHILTIVYVTKRLVWKIGEKSAD